MNPNSDIQTSGSARPRLGIRADRSQCEIPQYSLKAAKSKVCDNDKMLSGCFYRDTAQVSALCT